MSHLSKHCRERLHVGATVDPMPLIAEVEYYEDAYRKAQQRLVQAHMMLTRNGIDPLTGGPWVDRDTLSASTFGT